MRSKHDVIASGHPLTHRSDHPYLFGRRAERAAIDVLLGGAVEGRGGALVLRGDAGIGKTALLQYAVDSSEAMQVARIAGVHSEMELPYAAIHQLLSPMLSQLDDVPPRQRDALASAFGLIEGTAPDRFLVGVGALALLEAAAAEHPLLCAIDDAQWLDRASAGTLAFVTRRIRDVPIAMVLAARDDDEEHEPFAGLPELRLKGLGTEDARELLSTIVTGPLSEGLRECILLHAEGNPLALSELPEAMTKDELRGIDSLTWPIPITARLEDLFGRRMKGLPATARTALLVAAASPSDDPRLVFRAGERLGLDGSSVVPAVEEGLLRVEPRIAFRHPLVRSAAYAIAAPEDRRKAHEALANVTDPVADADQRAWHLSSAAAGPDEEVADELARAADRARRRGGFVAAAECLKRSAHLSPAPRDRAERYLAAAEAELAAGGAHGAAALVTAARAVGLDDVQTARAERLRGLVAFELGDIDEAASILVGAARAFATIDVRLARDTHLSALGAAMYAGPLAREGAVADAAAAALAAPKLPEQEMTAADFMLDGYANQIVGNLSEGAALLLRGIQMLRTSDDARVFLLSCGAALRVWDDDALREIALRGVELAREAGAFTALHVALHHLAFSEVGLGRYLAAEAAAVEAREISTSLGNGWSIGAHAPAELLVAACRGDDATTRMLHDTIVREATLRGEGVIVLFAEYALALLEIGSGRYREALPSVTRACGDDAAMIVLGLPDLVEAAARSGEMELAERALERLSAIIHVSRTAVGLGVQARCRALVADSADAGAHYREAIDHLRNSRAIPQLARTLLLYGEWLRRVRRRRDAREPLREALQYFESIGADAFADRARAELRATGERARSRSSDAPEELTAQEALIARLVADGASNPEVAAQLSISRKTVESHLTKVFAKLGVSSRGHLVRALKDPPD